MADTPLDTPLMRQYLEIKQQHPDAILFFRLGDFYEMFFEDAVYVARALDLTLTTRDKGREDAVPMCGVPHHAARHYIAKLLALGHRVALCEQVEDPRAARGIVKREVTRIVTPGVVLDEDQLDAKTGHFLAAVQPAEAGAGEIGLALLDVTTGDFRATAVTGLDALCDELARFEPHEVVGPAPEALRTRWRRAPFTAFNLDSKSDALAQLGELAPPGIAPLAARAAACALAYARATQPGGTLPIARLVVYQPAQFLVLDEATQANLELFETLMGHSRKGSLLAVLDQTVTAPGGRRLRSWIAFPLRDLAQIRRRQDAIELLAQHQALRDGLRRELTAVRDIERLAGRARLGVATPRDLAALRFSLERLPVVFGLLGAALADRLDAPELLVPHDDDLGDVAGDLAATLVDEPPIATRDGGYIRPGASSQLDELVDVAAGGKQRILAIEARERERTGIASLKVKYNRVFGYYLEVTRANLKSVPADYIRKQTLAGAERFVTPELADYEARVLGADERRVALEQELFAALRARVGAQATRLQAAGEQVAVLDVLAALAEVAHRNGYVRPLLGADGVLEIEDGRHPVVEQLAAPGGFVPNDTRLDPAAEQILVVTGPNMAGKSTVLRQVALIQLLGQMGAFVPARTARLPLCDRIFTRVGATDNLARGESTFMVEMRETANILRHATRDSLVVLDEIGRGTSTYDGLSIAWAVAEHLHDQVGARTLFATHYHELCALGATRPRVRNMQVAVKQWKNEVVFLRKLIPGGASRSYGIEVARLAGLPPAVLVRARALLGELERGRLGGATPQMDLFGQPEGPAGQGAGAELPCAEGERMPRERAEMAAGPPDGGSALLEALRGVDPNRMTPLEALVLVAELHRRATAGS
jgi:DNA mismatch repair protein MutS